MTSDQEQRLRKLETQLGTQRVVISKLIEQMKNLVRFGKGFELMLPELERTLRRVRP